MGEAARSLTDDLLRVTSYPPPRPRTVTLSATHASWVFLTDDEVWKLKRPVSYGFLDYRDPERRRRCCEEEVRLGLRLAPGVYRGVEPVYRGADGFSFVGPGDVVDAAVRMERLPDQDSALALLRAGRLTPAQLDALCARLAAFYSAAERTDGFGAPAALAAAIDQNHQQTLPYAGRYVDGALLERVHAAQRAAAAQADELLRARVRTGRIRDGHGDLRLEHIYFLSARGGAPVVIDPIEFNQGFRCQDVALDIAFLIMELEAEGRGDLATYVLSRFASASNDYDFFPLMNLYVGYRAWVRAKVACFVADDAGTPPDKARRKAAEAARLFALADAFAGPRPRMGAVVAVGGMIGAGKSTVAQALGLALPAPVISSDATRKALAGVAPLERAGPAAYDDRSTAATYAEVLRRAEVVLASGRDVVLDATFRKAVFRDAARALARQHHLRFLFVAMDGDDETLTARLRARDLDPAVSDARVDLLPWLRRDTEPPLELEPAEVLKVDASQPIGAVVTAVRARVTAGAP